jgi:hypothetical protein
MHEEPRNNTRSIFAEWLASNKLVMILRFSDRNSTGNELFARIPPTRAAAITIASGREE